jgi:hypothetical protein
MPARPFIRGGTAAIAAREADALADEQGDDMRPLEMGESVVDLGSGPGFLHREGG